MYIYIFHLSLTLVPCFQNTSNICPVQSIQNTQFYCCTYGMRSMCGVLISLRGTGVQLWILYFCIIIFSCQFRISFFIHDFFFVLSNSYLVFENPVAQSVQRWLPITNPATPAGPRFDPQSERIFVSGLLSTQTW